MRPEIRKLKALARELQEEVEALRAANARLQAAYRDLEAALKIADEARVAERVRAGTRWVESELARPTPFKGYWHDGIMSE